MKTRTKSLLIFIAIDIIMFFLGDIISPISNFIKQKKEASRERKIVEKAYESKQSEAKKEDLNCTFLTEEDFYKQLIALDFGEEHSSDLYKYIIKHARKANFISPEIKKCMISENYAFALPNDVSQKWLGKIYYNDNGDIKSFPPNVFSKGEFFENAYSKNVYYYCTREDFIDYLIMSGLPPKIAIAFEKKLQSPDFKKDNPSYGIEDLTLPESTRRIMNSMDFAYSIPVINGAWTGILNIHRKNGIFTINHELFPSYSDYFRYKSNVPIDVNGSTYNYIFYDKNWEIFSQSFFNANPITHVIYGIKNKYVEEKLTENTNLNSEVKNKMLEGNYMFAEPHMPESNKWLGIRNIMLNKKFYTFTY